MKCASWHLLPDSAKRRPVVKTKRQTRAAPKPTEPTEQSTPRRKPAEQSTPRRKSLLSEPAKPPLPKPSPAPAKPNPQKSLEPKRERKPAQRPVIHVQSAIASHANGVAAAATSHPSYLKDPPCYVSQKHIFNAAMAGSRYANPHVHTIHRGDPVPDVPSDAIYFVKHTDAGAGVGVQVTRNVAQAVSGALREVGTVTVERDIGRPYLHEGRKADLRAYFATVGGVDGLHVYLYDDALLRVCPEPYDATSLSRDVQMTNTSLGGRVSCSVHGAVPGSKDLMSRMKHVVWDVVERLRDAGHIDSRCDKYRATPELWLWGLDVLVSDDLSKLTVIEVNSRPSVGVDAKRGAGNEHFKRAMQRSVAGLVETAVLKGRQCAGWTACHVPPLVSLGRFGPSQSAWAELRQRIEYVEKLNPGSRFYRDTTGWDGCPLRSPGGDATSEGLRWSGRDASKTPQDTRYMTPRVAQIVKEMEASLGVRFALIRCMRLAKDGYIAPHSDGTRWRFHFPLQTDVAHVYMSMGSETFAMEAGHLYLMDAFHRHEVRNCSDQDRVHLILDVAQPTQALVRFPEAFQQAVRQAEPCRLARYVLRTCEGSRRLAVVFSGLGHLGNAQFSMYGASGALLKTHHVLHVRDLDRSWYQAAGAWYDLVRDIMARVGADKVVTVGQSMGGYAAIKIGNLLRAERAVALSPQAFLSAERRQRHGDGRFDADVRRLRIRDDLEATHVPTKIVCAKAAALDREHARLVRGAVVELVDVPGDPIYNGGHRLALYLSHSGSLEATIS